MAEDDILTKKSVKLQKILKNRITAISVLAFVVALCCIFAFAGNETAGTTDNVENSVAENNADVSESQTIVRPGYGIYVDGYFLAAANSLENANGFVDTALQSRITALGVDKTAKNSFKNSVQVVFGDYNSESFVEDVASLMGENVFDYSGTHLPVKLSVLSVTTYSENVVLDYETQIIFNDSMIEGTSDVEQEGFPGEGKQTYEVVFVDGVETERNPVSLEVITSPVNEQINVGVRPEDGKNTASIGNFVKPYDGIISSYYGYRWGRMHNGLDICQNGGCFKDPAYAAAGGVVLSAKDSNNGYGNCVIIDHGNGITTLYAHLNSCSVKEGDVVEAGDEIGLIGSTGYSFGPHLHFEVRIDGSPVDPLLFVDYE